VEGANADGTFVAGHDGEEAATNLMPFYGFCEADEPALLRHARLAHSPQNPLYASGVDGIWWEDGGWLGGATFPGWITGLAGAADERELHFRLEQIRRLTDLDGSIWWWPYDYGCTDLSLVRRRKVYGRNAAGEPDPVGLGKVADAAGFYVALFVTKILGLRVDVPDGKVWFQPFSSWPEFTWKGCRLGRARFDIAYSHSDGRISGELTNLNEGPLEAVVELVLPYATAAGECRIGDALSREVELTRRYGRPAVRVARSVASDESLRLEVRYRSGKAPGSSNQ
jgi:hypothetical protein